MIKILTYINTAAVVVVLGSGAFAYFQRGKITDALLDQVKGQIPGLLQKSIPTTPKLPDRTGPVMSPMSPMSPISPMSR